MHGAALTAARGASSLSAWATFADVGGGDDHVLVVGGRAGASGGPGNDTLEGFASAESSNGLDGGPGDDIIRGDGKLTGGAGRDQLTGSGTFNGDGVPTLEPDVIVGGPGRDWVDFTGTSTPVAVDLSDPGA